MSQYILILFAINIFFFKNDNQFDVNTSWTFKTRYEDSIPIEQVKIQCVNNITRNDSTFITIILSNYEMISGTWASPQFSKDLKTIDTAVIVTYKNINGQFEQSILDYSPQINLYVKPFELDTHTLLYNGQSKKLISTGEPKKFFSSYLEGIGLVSGIYYRADHMPCGTIGGCYEYYKYEYELIYRNEIPFSISQLTTVIYKDFPILVCQSSGGPLKEKDLLGRTYNKNRTSMVIIKKESNAKYKRQIKVF